MRLIQMKCPDCGSTLDIDVEGRPALFCQFCGTRLLIDDEVKKVQLQNSAQAGYEFEQGRIRAREEEARKAREKQKKIEEARRVMKMNYEKHRAIAEQERDIRNGKYALHGFLLFAGIVLFLVFLDWPVFIKVIAGVMAGSFIYAVQSAKCRERYEHSYNDHVETDEDGNIIHAEKL